MLTKITDRFLSPDQRQLKKLLRDISADQAEIFLKTVHPEIWQKLLDRATIEKQATVLASTTPKQEPERKKVRWPFKLAALGAIGFSGWYYLPQFDQTDFDQYSDKFSEWQKEGERILYEEIPQQAKKLKEEGTQLADKFFIEINKRIDSKVDKPATPHVVPELKDGVLATGPVSLEFNQITKSDVNVRALPSHTAKSLGTAKMGGCVYVLKIVDGKWAHFRGQDNDSNITEGYIAGSRLTPLIGQTAKCTFELQAR